MTETILVTGGNGFLALRLIQQLLTAGYAVRATLRDLAKQPQVVDPLAAAQTPHLERLDFVAADLTQDAGWAAAMTGVSAVMSVAAPVFVNGETPTAALTGTAKAGALRVLRAAADAGVRRVIWTGNLGAVGFSNHDRQRATTEANWTRADEPGLSAYERSKLLAEQAAWAFAKTHDLALTVVNAGAMLGPALSPHVSGSFGLVQGLIAGRWHAVAPITVNVVDVRDVAALHLAALQHPESAGQRLLAVAATPIALPAAAQLIRRQLPALAPQVARFPLPAWLIRALAPVNATAAEGRLFLAISHRVDPQNAHRLGWRAEFSAEQAVLATVASLTHA